MADSEAQQPAQQVALKRSADYTKKVTSTVPATKQKNPKRVAARKATAERTKQAREEQKKKYPRLTSSLQTISLKKLKRLLLLPIHQPLTQQPETF